MNLSDLPTDDATTKKPLRLSDIEAPKAPKPATDGGADFPFSAKSFINVPSEIGREFAEGAHEASQGFEKASTATSELGRDVGGAQWLMGGIREFFSPITGSAKALVGDPIRKAIPGKAGEVLANTGEIGASMVGPGVVGKSLETLGRIVPGYKDAVRTLMDAGVKLTPGQIAQGAMKSFESAVSRVPYVGSFQRSGEIQSLEGFNRAVVNEALKPIGGKLPPDVKAGRDSISYAERVIGDRYDQLLSKATWLPDQQFAADLQQIETSARVLPPDRRDQLTTIVQDIGARAGPNGLMDSKTYKIVESELNYLGRSYARANDPDQRHLGMLVNDLNGAMKSALERSNPKIAPELADTNAAWAAFTRARDASIRRVPNGQAEIGLFSPTDLQQTIKQANSKGVFARGDAVLQKLADAGSQVLPATVPTMKEAERLMWAGVFGTGAHFVAPAVIPPLAAMSTLYTKPGMWLTNKAAQGIPSASRSIVDMLETPEAATFSGLAGANQ